MFNRQGNKFIFLAMAIIHLNDLYTLIIDPLNPVFHIKQTYESNQFL